MPDLERMPAKELWDLHDQIRELLISRLIARVNQLEARLDALSHIGESINGKPASETLDRRGSPTDR